ncbi:hypothetical protein [Glaesserella sp.]|uniref:hypothetical protein n=1 Tax=Glaesserella sp. TaxID=2094731 RepID=UPI0035A009B2
MKKIFFILFSGAFVMFSIAGCGKALLDPISSVKEQEVKGRKDKTYEQMFAQSGRCDNPLWVQETKDITWQDSTLSHSIKVSVTCNSKGTMQLRSRFGNELIQLERIASSSIEPEVFEQIQTEYEEKKSSQTPVYNEHRLKQLANEFCQFPEASKLPELINALIDPRSVCTPTIEQKTLLNTEFSFKYGTVESLLWPFYKARAIEVAKSTNLEEVENSRSFDIEEKTVFTVQYRKVGRTGKKMKHAKYDANVGGNFYELKVNGEVKTQQSHPNVADIFEKDLFWE